MARIEVRPIAGKNSNDKIRPPQDFRLSVFGACLSDPARNKTSLYTLHFDFRHPPRDEAGSFDVSAAGWIFGKDIRLAQSIRCATSPCSVPLTLPQGKITELIDSIFDGLLIRPTQADLTVGFRMPAKQQDHFVWSFGVTAKGRRGPAQQFRLAAGPFPSAQGSLLASAPVVDVWRDPHQGEQVNQSGPSQSDRPATRAALISASLPPRSIIATRDEESATALASGNQIVLRRMGAPACGVATLARVVGPQGTELVSASVEISAVLIVTTGRSGSRAAPYEEGGFPCRGMVALSKPVGSRDTRLDARLALTDAVFALHTAFGGFSATRPEAKKTRPEAERAAAPVRIEARRWGDIETFEVTALVFDAGVGLMDDQAGHKPRDVTSRLDFHGGAETRFGLRGVRLSEGGNSGRVLLGFAAGAPVPSGLPPFLMPMESAVLRIMRVRTLAALKFRFAGLDLAGNGKTLWLVPRGRSQPAVAADAGASAHVTAGRTFADALHDPRPILVVELPPQHIAEEAFFEQRVQRPNPPDLPPAVLAIDEVRQRREDLRRSYAPPACGRDCKRNLARQRLKTRALVLNGLLMGATGTDDTFKAAVAQLAGKTAPAFDVPKGDRARVDEFLTFAARFWNSAKAQVKPRLPKEQWFYIGSEFLDPEARRLAESTVQPKADADPDGFPIALRDDMPEDPLSPAERAALGDASSVTASGGASPDDSVNERISRLRWLRDPYFAKYKEVYDTLSKSALPAGPPFPGIASNWPAITTYAGRTPLAMALVEIRGQALADPAQKEKFRQLMKTVRQLGIDVANNDGLQKLQLGGNETPTRPVKVRLSGPSRLAFRINTDDFESADYPGGSIPFSAEELTNWSRFELSVVRRAQKLFKTYSDGTHRPLWDAEEDKDLARMLLHQGFSRGGDLCADTIPGADQPAKDPTCQGRQERPWSAARVTLDQRLAEVAAFAVAAPDAFETAIEMPFRLMLSPSQDGRFRTPRALPDGLFANGDTTLPPAIRPLWMAEFDTVGGAEVRAVWSPDFRPEAFVLRRDGKPTFLPTPARANRAPLRGPYEPWAIGRDVTGAATAAELTQIANQLGMHRFRTSLDAFDRHELVTLSSLHGLPVTGRVREDGTRVGIDQREPPVGFRIAIPGDADAVVPDWKDYSDIYVPRPLDRQGMELALSAMGGFLRLNAAFEPPSAVLDRQGRSAFDSLSIERWRHRIVLGRDISVEVVYKGYLYPFGLRTALIKTTERRFEAINGHGGPVAVLRQRMFLQVTRPEKEFAAFRQADEGRRLPFRKLRLLTTTSPDLVDPFDISGTADGIVFPSGLIKPGNAGTNGTAFWPRTARRNGGEVMFDILLDDKVKTRLPLIFVDNVAATDPATIQALTGYYNGLSDIGADDTPGPAARPQLIQAQIGGAKLTYAPEFDPGDTQFETLSITFAAEGWRAFAQEPPPATYDPRKDNNVFFSDAFMAGLDQPPFYPAMRRAFIKVTQIDRLTGQPGLPTRVAYDPSYAIHGFTDRTVKNETGGKLTDSLKNQRDIFLSLIDPKPLAFGDAGDKGGGIARPELNVVALSRSRGPVSLSVSPGGPAALGTPAPATSADGTAIAEQMKGRGLVDFFPDNAKLLGIVSFKELLTEITQFVDLEPTLKEITEFGGGLADDADAFIRDQILAPLNEVLSSFAQRLNDVTINEVKGEAALKRIYPDLFSAFTEFRKKIEEALSGSANQTTLDRKIELYSGVYATGRRFVVAIERTARDPITPLREALRRQFDDLRQLLEGQLSATISALLAQARPERFRKALADFVRDSVAKPAKSLLFRLPLPDNASSPPLDLSGALDAALDKALDAPETWPKTGNTLFDAKAFRTALIAALAQDPKLAQYKAALEAVAADEAAIAGVLWATFDTLQKRLATAIDDLRRAADKAALDAVPLVQDFGAVLGQALMRLDTLAEAARAFSSPCEEAIGALDGFVRMVVPLQALDGLDCVTTGSGCAAVPEGSPLAFAVALLRLCDGTKVLIANETNKLGALINTIRTAPKVANTAHAEADRLESVKTLLQAFASAVAGREDALTAALKRLRTAAKVYEDTTKNDIPAFCSGSIQGKPLARIRDALLQIERERRVVLGILYDGVAKGLIALIPSAEAFAKTFASPSVIAPNKGSLTITPQPFADPKSWTWDTVIPNSSAEAVYLAETARKDVLGLVLPAIGSLADVAAQLTSLGSFLKKDSRSDARTRLETLLTKVSSSEKAATTAKEIAQKLKQPPLTEASGIWNSIQDQYANSGWSQITAVIKSSDAVPSDLEGRVALFAALIDATKPTSPDISGAATSLVSKAKTTLDGVEAAALDFLVRAASTLDEVRKNAFMIALPVLGRYAAKPAADLFAAAQASRTKIVEAIGRSDQNQTRTPIDQQIDATIRKILSVYPTDQNKPYDDDLKKQADDLRLISESLDNVNPDNVTVAEEKFIRFVTILDAWTTPLTGDDPAAGPHPNPILVIADRIRRLADDVRRGQIGRIIDFAIVRRAIEERLRQLIPSRLTLAYDLDIPLDELPPLLSTIFQPASEKGPLFPDPGIPNTRLTLKARTTIDLLNGGEPKTSVSGELGKFAIALLGNVFDVVSLTFDGARYDSATGGRLQTHVTDVKLGSAVAFLQTMGSFFSFEKNGFYYALLFDVPGIEAGYRMPPIDLILGALNFTNLSLNAGCVLPFGDGQALFKVGLSRPDSPFAIFSGIYGGTGHLSLYATAKEIVGFDASLEFGAVTHFRVGPLMGKGQITAGVFIRSLVTERGRTSTVEGVFTAAGSANIAIFTVAARLQVRVGQQPSGKLAGSAIFTYSFSFGIKSIEFRLVLYKEEGQGFSGGANGLQSTNASLPFDRVRYAAAGDAPDGGAGTAARWSDLARLPNRRTVKLISQVKAMDKDFAGYRHYFSDDKAWVPL